MAKYLISCDTLTGKFYKHVGLSSTITDSFSTTYAAPMSLCYTNSYLIGATTSKCYKHLFPFSSTIKDSFSVVSINTRGISWDGYNTLTNDTGTGKIYKHDDFSYPVILNSFSSPSNVPQGLFFLNNDVYSTDTTLDKIYRHSGFSSTIRNSFSSPSDGPIGIAYDSDTDCFISADSTTDKIYIHDGFGTSILDSFSSPSTGLTSITYGEEPTGFGIDVYDEIVVLDFTPRLIELNINVYMHGSFTSYVDRTYNLLKSLSREYVPQLRGGTVDPEGNPVLYNYNAGGPSKVYRMEGYGKTVKDSFSSPSHSSSYCGLTYIGNYLYFANTSGIIYQYEGMTGKLIATLTGMGDSFAMGNLGGNLVRVDSTKVYKHLSTTTTVLDSFSSPTTVTYGLTVDENNNVIAFDNNTGKIFKYSGFSSVIIDSFSSSQNSDFLGYDTRKNVIVLENDFVNPYEIKSHDWILINELAITSPPNISIVIYDSIIVDDERTTTVFASLTKIWRFYNFYQSIADSFSSPSTNLGGIVYDGNNILSSDNTADKAYKHSGFSSTISNSFSTPSTTPTGVTWDGTNIYSNDTTTDKVYQHTGFSASIGNSFSSPSTLPRGLAWDGTNIWSSDGSNTKVFKHSGFSATISNSFSSPSSSPFSLGWFKNSLLLGDLIYVGRGVVFRYNSDTLELEQTSPMGLSTSIYGATYFKNTPLLTSPYNFQFFTWEFDVGDDILIEEDINSNIPFELDEYITITEVVWISIPTICIHENISVDEFTDIVDIIIEIGVIYENISVADYKYDLLGTTAVGNRAIKFFYYTSSVITDSFSTPSTSPVGICGARGSVYTSDTIANKIYRHAGFSNQINNSFSSPTSFCRSIAIDNNDNMLCNSTNPTKIYKMSGFSSTISDSFSTPSTFPYGMGYDSTNSYVLSTDYSAAKVYQHNGFSATVLNSFSSPSTQPRGVTWYPFDGGSAIVHEYSNMKVYKMVGFSATIENSFSSPITFWGFGNISDTTMFMGVQTDTLYDTITIQEDVTLQKTILDFLVGDDISIFEIASGMDILVELSGLTDNITINEDFNYFLYDAFLFITVIDDVYITEKGFNPNEVRTTNGSKTVCTYTGHGSFNVTNPGTVEILVVGGGGGTTGHSGGGGGGGVVYHSGKSVTAGTYIVRVGAGGVGKYSIQYPNPGENSICGDIIALGGGGGYYGSAVDPYGDGGSGGGSGGSGTTPGDGLQGNSGGGTGYGNDGGTGVTGGNGAGGGGAGAVGGAGTSGSSPGGNGGDGVAFSISGSSVYYGGGGGGSGNYNNSSAPGSGGLGGGGNAGGSTYGAPNTGGNGTDGLGGGAGGASYNGYPGDAGYGMGGNGGRGTVIVSYTTADNIAPLETMILLSDANPDINKYDSITIEENYDEWFDILGIDTYDNILAEDFIYILLSDPSLGRLIATDWDSAKIYAHVGFTNVISNSFSSPMADPVGVAFDSDKNIWSTDSTTSKIWKHRGFTSTILNSFSSPSTNPRGLYVSNTNIYSTDGSSNKVYKHTGFTNVVANSFSSPSGTLRGITIGTAENVITSDNGTDKLYLHSGFSSTISNSFSSPETSPLGLAWDGTNVYSAGGDTDKFYKHNGFSNTILNSFSSPSTTPYGLYWDAYELLPPIYVQETVIAVSEGLTLTDDNGDYWFSDAHDDLLITEWILFSLPEITTPLDNILISEFVAFAIALDLFSTDIASDKIYYHSGFSTTIINSFSSPSSQPEGVAQDTDGNMISTDTATGKIYMNFGFTTRVINSFSAPWGGPTGVIYIDGTLWSTDGTLNKVYQHNGFSTRILDSFSSPTIGCGGLSYDGTNIITSSSSKIYQHVGKTSSILNSFSSPGTSNADVAKDSWSTLLTDPVTDKIYRMAEFTNVISNSFSSPSTAPYGLSFKLYDFPTGVYGSDASVISEYRTFDIRGEFDENIIYAVDNILIGEYQLVHDPEIRTVYDTITVTDWSGEVGDLVSVDNTGGTNGRFYRYAGWSATVIASFSVGRTAFAVYWDGTRLYSTDSGMNGIAYRHLPGFTASTDSSLAPSTGTMAGLCLDSSGNAITSWNSQKYQIRSGWSNSIVNSFSSPGTSAGACTWKMGNFYSSDSSFGRVYKHSGFSSTLTNSFSSPTNGNQGVYIDWEETPTTSAANAEKIWKHTKNFVSTITNSFSAPGVNTRGVTLMYETYRNAILASLVDNGDNITIEEDFTFDVAYPVVIYDNIHIDEYRVLQFDLLLLSTPFDSIRVRDIYLPPITAEDAFYSSDSTSDKVYRHAGFSSTILNSFSSPSSVPTGLVFNDKAELMTIDTTTDKIYLHAGFSPIIKDSFSSPSLTPNGIASDGVNVYSSDNTSDKIYKHSGFSSTISNSFSSPNTVPTGIVWLNSTLFSTDQTSDKIYQHNGFSSTITNSFSSPSTTPYGLAFDTTNIYSTDSTSDKIYQHQGFSNVIADSFSSTSTSPTGVTWLFETSELSVPCIQTITKTEWVDLVVDEIRHINKFDSIVIKDWATIRDIFDGVITADGTMDKIYIHNGFTATLLDSFSSPSTSPVAIEFNGIDLITIDTGVDKVYRHFGVTASITNSFSSPQASLLGVTWDYQCNGVAVADKYSVNPVYIIYDEFSSTQKYTTGNISPSTVTSVKWHEGYLYGVNSTTTDKFIKYSYEPYGTWYKVPTIINSFSSPSTNPEDVTFDINGNLISSDSALDKIYYHLGFSSTITNSFSSPSTFVTGVTWYNNQQYIIYGVDNIHIDEVLDIDRDGNRDIDVGESVTISSEWADVFSLGFFVADKGDTTFGGTITADSEAAAKENAFDKNTSTYWQSVGGGAGHWVKYDYGSGKERVCTLLRIFNSGATGGPSNNGIAGFYFQGSNNDSDWTTLVTDTCPAAADWYEWNFVNTTAYRYYRVYSTSSYHVDAILIKELAWWGEGITVTDSATVDLLPGDLINHDDILIEDYGILGFTIFGPNLRYDSIHIDETPILLLSELNIFVAEGDWTGNPPDMGTGADGAITHSSSGSITSGTYNYTNFTINNSVEMIAGKPTTIKCTGTFRVDGQLHCGGSLTIYASKVIVSSDAIISGSLTIRCGEIENSGIITNDALMALGGKTYKSYLDTTAPDYNTNYVVGRVGDGQTRDVTQTFKTATDIATIPYHNRAAANTVSPQYSYIYLGTTVIDYRNPGSYGDDDSGDLTNTTGYTDQTYARSLQVSSWRVAGASYAVTYHCKMLMANLIVDYARGSAGILFGSDTTTPNLTDYTDTHLAISEWVNNGFDILLIDTYDTAIYIDEQVSVIDLVVEVGIVADTLTIEENITNNLDVLVPNVSNNINIDEMPIMGKDHSLVAGDDVTVSENFVYQRQVNLCLAVNGGTLADSATEGLRDGNFSNTQHYLDQHGGSGLAYLYLKVNGSWTYITGYSGSGDPGWSWDQQGSAVYSNGGAGWDNVTGIRIYLQCQSGVTSSILFPDAHVDYIRWGTGGNGNADIARSYDYEMEAMGDTYPVIDAHDDILITEDIFVEKLAIGVNEDINIDEYNDQYLTELFINVYDDITHFESISIIDLVVEIWTISDTITIEEYKDILLPILNINIYDQITIEEDKNILLPILVISVYDEVYIVEMVPQPFFPWLAIEPFDTIPTYRALYFNGTNAGATASPITLGNDFTFEIKFNDTRNNGTHQRILSMGNFAGFVLNQYAGTTEIYVSNSNAANLWTIGSCFARTHYVMTVATDTCTHYKDGSLQGSKVQGNPSTSGVTMEIGSKDAVYWQGNIEYIRLYNRILTSTEISSHYNGMFTDDTSLVGYWDFRELTGSTAYDYSSGGHNLSLTNTEWIHPDKITDYLDYLFIPTVYDNIYQNEHADVIDLIVEVGIVQDSFNISDYKDVSLDVLNVAHAHCQIEELTSDATHLWGVAYYGTYPNWVRYLVKISKSEPHVLTSYDIGPIVYPHNLLVDDNYIWIADNNYYPDCTITRLLKSNPEIRTVFPVTLGYDADCPWRGTQDDNYLYYNDSASEDHGRILRILKSDPTQQLSIETGVESLYGVDVRVDDTYIWSVSYYPGRLCRTLKTSPYTNDEYSFTDSGMIPEDSFWEMEHDDNYVYISIDYGSISQLLKVSKSDPTSYELFNLPYGANLFMNSDDTYLYIGTYNDSPQKIMKILKSDPNTVTSYTLYDFREGVSATTDSTYLWVGESNYAYPNTLLRFTLSDGSYTRWELTDQYTYDFIAIAEYNEQYLDVLNIDLYDNITIDEYTELLDLVVELDIYEDILVEENIYMLDIVVEIWTVYEDITVEEYRDVVLDVLNINVYDTILWAEFSYVIDLIVEVWTVDDDIYVSEDKNVSLDVLNISRWNCISVGWNLASFSESSTAQTFDLQGSRSYEVSSLTESPMELKLSHSAGNYAFMDMSKFGDWNGKIQTSKESVVEARIKTVTNNAAISIYNGSYRCDVQLRGSEVRIYTYPTTYTSHVYDTSVYHLYRVETNWVTKEFKVYIDGSLVRTATTTWSTSSVGCNIGDVNLTGMGYGAAEMRIDWVRYEITPDNTQYLDILNLMDKFDNIHIDEYLEILDIIIELGIVYDDILVEEYREVVDLIVELEVYDEVVIEEYLETFSEEFLDVYDNIPIVEQAWLLDIIVEIWTVWENIPIEEWVCLRHARPKRVTLWYLV